MIGEPLRLTPLPPDFKPEQAERLHILPGSLHALSRISGRHGPQEGSTEYVRGDIHAALVEVVRRYLAADDRVFAEHYSVESIQGLADAMGALRAAMLAHDA